MVKHGCSWSGGQGMSKHGCYWGGDRPWLSTLLLEWGPVMLKHVATGLGLWGTGHGQARLLLEW